MSSKLVDVEKTVDILVRLRKQAQTSIDPQKLVEDFLKLESLLQNPIFRQNLTVQYCPHSCIGSRDQFHIGDRGQLILHENNIKTVTSPCSRNVTVEPEISGINAILGRELERIAPNGQIKSVILLNTKREAELGWVLIGTSRRLVVVHINPQGNISRQGLDIKPGDELLAVDTQLVAEGNWSAIRVIQYIDSKLKWQSKSETEAESPGTVHGEGLELDGIDEGPLVLTLAPNHTLESLSLPERLNSMVLSGEWTQMQAIELTNDGSGLGFGIVGGRSTGVVVKTVLPGGPAHRDGRLRTGDHILQIGSINLHGMSSQQVAMILRQQEGPNTRLVVGRPTDSTSPSPYSSLKSVPSQKEDNGSDRGAYTVLTKTAIDPGLFEAHLVELETEKLDLDEANIPTDLPALLGLTSNTFCRENWVEGLTQQYQVQLERDQSLGLGITVAGYVHKKEEISGIFVKGLVAGSAAERDGRIETHDLILKVNEKSLESLSHANCVQELVNSGVKVKLELIRFLSGSPQAKYLDILRGQDLTVQDSDKKDMAIDDLANEERAVPKSLTEDQIRGKWRGRVGDDRDIIIADVVRPDSCTSGLGLSLEGTVDVVDGTETSPHHYIQSVDPGSPADISASLKPGDELLEVDGISLHGKSHVDVVRTISACKSSIVKLVVARIVPSALVFGPKDPEQPSVIPERLVKAKSEIILNPNWDTYELLEEVARRLRSRSLEPLNNLAVWSTTPTTIFLNKGDRGLGFSVLDYQDPLHPSETVIVVRSLVPGGVASQDGRVIPGDRLLFVNERDLHNADLTEACDALKSAPRGKVKIGLAKPLPLHNEDNMKDAPIITQTERLLAKGALASPFTKRKRKEKRANESRTPPPLPTRPPPDWSSSTPRKRLDPQAYYSRSYALYGSLPQSKPTSTLSGSWLSMNSWSAGSSPSLSPAPSPSSLLRGSWAADIIHLPQSMERSLKLKKGSEPLGVTVEAVDKAVNGCQVKTMLRSGAFGRDGRVQVGDLITRLNNESLRNATNSQAKTVLNRTNLVYADIPVTFISGAEAEKYKETAEKNPVPESPLSSINRLSPKSPYFTRKEFVPSNVDVLSDGGYSDLQSTTADISLMTSQSEIESAEAAATWVLSQSLVDQAIKQAVQSLTAHKEMLINKMLLQEEIVPESVLSEVSAVSSTFDIDNKDECDKNEEIIRQKLSAKPSPVPSDVGASSGNSESLMSASSTRSKYWGDPRTVTLIREPSRSLGISIVGGRVEVSRKGGLPGTGTTVSGIFIKSVLSGSPAGRNGQMSMGDRILTVNGVDLREATHEQAVEVIKTAANPIKFVLQSLHSLPSQQITSGGSTPKDSSAPSSTPTTPSLGKKATSPIHTNDVYVDYDLTSPMMADATIEATLATTSDISAEMTAPEPVYPPVVSVRRNTESGMSDKPSNRTIEAYQHQMRQTRVSSLTQLNGRQSPAGVKSADGRRSRVDSLSAAALQRQDTDPEIEDAFGYTKMKIESRYMDLDGELVFVTLDRTPEGLGLSLVGNRDRSKMSVFVCGISPNGAAAKVADKIRIGDEVVEINGIVLQGRSHLNASAIIRGLKDSAVKLVLLRNCNALLEMAIPHDLTNSDHITPPQRTITTVGEEESKENEPPSPSSPSSAPPKTPSPSAPPKPPPKELIPRTVALHRGPDGFGITLTEGTTTDNLRGIFVTNISPECPTAKNGSLRIGDQILSVNGQAVEDSTSTKVAQAIQLAEGPEVELIVSTHMVVPLPSTANSIGSPMNTTPESKTISTMAEINPKPSPIINFAINSIVVGEETFIEIEKGGKGLGLSIVGGSDTVLGSVVIHEVYPDGAAAKDARLKPGDQVLEVNHQSLREVSHDMAISLLRQTPSKVRLLVFRDPNLQLSLLDPTQIYNVFEVELMKKPGRGLGLSIVGRKTEPGVYVSEVVKGGAAETDGRLSQGDQILAVNGQDLTAAMQEQAAAILKTCIGKVILKIGRWKLSDSSSSSGPSSCLIPTIQNQKATSSSETSSVLASSESKPTTTVPSTPTEPTVTEPKLVTQSKLDTEPINLIPEPELEKPLEIIKSPELEKTDSVVKPISKIVVFKEEGSETLVIELEKKADVQLGMGIGKRPRGVLVTSLQPGSQAALHLKVGDKILAVNGVEITDADQSTAVKCVKESGAKLTLHIARPVEDNKFSMLQICLNRGEDGLGFSIVGGSNGSHGDLPIFVKAVYSRGAAAKEGQLKRGDEIVAVNDLPLNDVSHDTAVQLLKEARGTVLLTVIPSNADN